MTDDIADDPRLPPDFQALISVNGGYDKIGPAAWERWDGSVAAWQQRRREYYRSLTGR